MGKSQVSNGTQTQLRPLAYCASALTTELLRPDVLTDSHTPIDLVTEVPVHKCYMEYMSLPSKKQSNILLNDYNKKIKAY